MKHLEDLFEASTREEMWVIFSGRRCLVKLTGGRKRRKKSRIYKGKYQLNESSATKLPWGNLVWQSGLGEHSPESNLTEVTKVKLPEA